MSRKRVSLAILAVAAFCGHAQAQVTGDSRLDPPGSSEEIADALKNCEDNRSVTATLYICAWDHFRRADAMFRSAVETAHLAMAEKQGLRAAMDRANDAFKKFRDMTCDFDSANTGGGTMEPLIEVDCLATYTDRRAKALTRYALCEKTGDCDLPNFLYPDENAPSDLKKEPQEPKQ